MAAWPCSFADVGIQFTEEEVHEVIGGMPPHSSSAPDAIMPLLVKGLFKTREIHNVCIQRGARARMFPSLLVPRQHNLHPETGPAPRAQVIQAHIGEFSSRQDPGTTLERPPLLLIMEARASPRPSVWIHVL